MQNTRKESRNIAGIFGQKGETLQRTFSLQERPLVTLTSEASLGVCSQKDSNKKDGADKVSS
jgi:hypothetical protein